MSEAIQRKKLYEQVLDRLRARIVSGEIPPGGQLPSERELMEEYDVGRPAVREALQTLERSGIVEIVHGERARVVVPTAGSFVSQIADGVMHVLRTQPHALGHLKDARLLLETGTARIAAQVATEEQIARLRLSVAQHRASMVDLARFIEHDMAFHKEIAAISGNPVLSAIVEAVFRWASEYYQTMVRAPGAEEVTLAEHTAIVDAIAAGDAEAAAAAMHAHLSRSSALYQRFSESARDQSAAPASRSDAVVEPGRAVR